MFFFFVDRTKMDPTKSHKEVIFQHSSVTDCNFNGVRCRSLTDLFVVKCHLKLHIDITCTVHYIIFHQLAGNSPLNQIQKLALE